jgi:ATP-dependent DNA helicase RecQ
MLEYATANYPCRSRMLLSYFGEKNNHNCGICDTCVTMRKGEKMLPETNMDELQRQVIALLGEQPLFPHVIAKTINADKDALAVLLRQLLEEEVVSMNNGLIQLNLKQ